MIEVGSLLMMKYNYTQWLALDEIGPSVLVASMVTGHKMWAEKAAFEVVG